MKNIVKIAGAFQIVVVLTTKEMNYLVESSVDFDQRYSAYPTPTYPSDSVSVAKNSEDMNGKTKSARNFIYTLIRLDKCILL